MLKQWMDIVNTCITTPWLNLYDFSETQKKVFDFLYTIVIRNIGFMWAVVVIIWLLLTFRKDDLKAFQIPPHSNKN